MAKKQLCINKFVRKYLVLTIAITSFDSHRKYRKQLVLILIET